MVTSWRVPNIALHLPAWTQGVPQTQQTIALLTCHSALTWAFDRGSGKSKQLRHTIMQILRLLGTQMTCVLRLARGVDAIVES